jgi:hypothetical protein
MDAFLENTRDLDKVVLIRKTSGEAARSWANESVGLIFVDAVHDYVNVAHDICAWSPKLAVGGILAFHDTDDKRFSGARCAVFKALQRSNRFSLFAHADNLTMLRKNS